MTDPLAQGATIGILGGGQLGRMLSVAASRLGFATHVYDPAPNPPAGGRGPTGDDSPVRRF